MKPIYSCFLVNGEVVDASAAFHPEINRSFLFGDGVFESIRMENGRLLFADFHIDRLIRSLKALKISAHGTPEPKVLEKIIVKHTQLLEARVKLLAFRNSNGAYLPESNDVGYFLQVSKLNSPCTFPEQGLTVGVYEEQQKVAGALSWMKSTSSQLYVMARLHATEQDWDDCLLLNDKNELIEGSSSNLFALIDGRWITPPISSGCIEGVYRQVLMAFLKNSNAPFTESSIRRDDALRADELILTNAISGIRWIAQFEGKTYGCSEAKKLFSAMQH
jgi:branched-chain amino acid aminotransferase